MNNFISTLLIYFTLLIMLFLHVLDPFSDVEAYVVAEQMLRFMLVIFLKDIVTLGVYTFRKDTTV